MAKNIPDEVVTARVAIETARVLLESLFEKMSVMPRSEKVMVTDTVREACSRLQAAQELLARLEADPTPDERG